MFFMGAFVHACDSEKSGICAEYLERLKKIQQVAEEATQRAMQAEQRVSLLEKMQTVVRSAEKLPNSGLSRAVKIAATIAGGTITLGTGIFAYRHDILGFGSFIGSYGSWYQSFRNWLGIKRVEATQEKHGKKLDGIGTRLDKVVTRQGAHTGLLNGLRDSVGALAAKLNNFEPILDSHTEVLGQHTDTLSQHTTALDKIHEEQVLQRTTLNTHGSKLDDIKGGLEQLTQNSAQQYGDVSQRLQNLESKFSGMETQISDIHRVATGMSSANTRTNGNRLLLGGGSFPDIASMVQRASGATFHNLNAGTQF